MSENSIIQIYSSAAGDASASVDMPDEGLLLGAAIAAQYTANADGEGVNIELSFGSTSSFSSNDGRSIIAQWSGKVGLLTSGAASNAINQQVSFADGIKVFAGERIFTHNVAIGAGAFEKCKILLLMRFKSFVPRRR